MHEKMGDPRQLVEWIFLEHDLENATCPPVNETEGDPGRHGDGREEILPETQARLIKRIHGLLNLAELGWYHQCYAFSRSRRSNVYRTRQS